MDADRNRRAILAAADRLFTERGCDVPMALIAAEAGVGRATLHRNFASRADLAMALIERNMREIRAFAAGQQGLPTDLEELIDLKLYYYVHNSGPVEAARTGLITTDFTAERNEVAAIMFAAAQHGIAAGIVRPDVSVDTFVILQLAMAGVLAGGGTVAERAARAASLKSLVMDGLRN